MANRRKRRRKQSEPSSAAPPKNVKSATGKAVLAWGMLVALILVILAILEMVKESLAAG